MYGLGLQERNIELMRRLRAVEDVSGHRAAEDHSELVEKLIQTRVQLGRALRDGLAECERARQSAEAQFHKRMEARAQLAKAEAAGVDVMRKLDASHRLRRELEEINRDVAAERDDLRRRLAAMHERAQWAEAVANEAMRVGLAHVEAWRDSAAHFDYAYREARAHATACGASEVVPLAKHSEAVLKLGAEVVITRQRATALHRRAQQAEGMVGVVLRAGRDAVAAADARTRDAVHRARERQKLTPVARAVVEAVEKAAALLHDEQRAALDDARALAAQALREGLSECERLREALEKAGHEFDHVLHSGQVGAMPRLDAERGLRVVRVALREVRS
jgi:hypothetical protein